MLTVNSCFLIFLAEFTFMHTGDIHVATNNHKKFTHLLFHAKIIWAALVTIKPKVRQQTPREDIITFDAFPAALCAETYLSRNRFAATLLSHIHFCSTDYLSCGVNQ